MSRWSKDKKKLVYRADKERVLLTEVLPEEVPLTFSNDGFYKISREISNQPSYTKAFYDEYIATNNIPKPTRPFHYTITHKSEYGRRLSLMHPSWQIRVVDFYTQYSEIICHLLSASRCSIRYPSKIGTIYYSHSSNITTGFKGSAVAIETEEYLSERPPSYFSYKKYNRLFKFYDNKEFIELETKYSSLICIDIQKCFDSIYTHSIAWAIPHKNYGKSSIRHHTFPNKFDELMTSGNYQETSGIAIGPEISRIFAEFILQSVDKNVISELERKGVRHEVDYSIRRYIDDIFVFSNSSETTKSVKSCYRKKLHDVNLFLNDSKSKEFKRPIITEHSILSRDIFRLEEEYQEKWTRLIRVGGENGKNFNIPLIENKEKNSAFLKFSRDIKALCKESDQDFSIASSLLLGRFVRNAIKIASIPKRIFKHEASEAKYEFFRNYIYFFISTSFFLFSVSPSVANSQNLCRILLTIRNMIQNKYPSDSPAFDQIISEKIFAFIRAYLDAPIAGNLMLEKLNLLTLLSTIPSHKRVDEKTFLDIIKSSESGLNYFICTSLIYYIKDESGYENLTSIIENYILNTAENQRALREKSEAIHLYADSLTCPHLSLSFKTRLVKQVHPNLTTHEQNELINEFSQKTWFTNWSEVNLLILLKKKRLNSSY